MLSKNTQNLFSMLLRASHNIKPRYFAPLVHSVSPSPLTTGLPQLHNSLHSFSKYPFSNSAKDDSDSNNTKPTSETENKANEDEKINPEKAKLKVNATTAKKEKSTTSAPATAEKVEEKKLQTAPIRPVKLPLREGEEELKVETYVLFNSNTPIIPYSHQNGLIKTGNLGTSHISNKLAFFLQNAVGEIYTVGIILEDNVNKTLKKTFTQGTSSPAAGAGAGAGAGGRNAVFSLEEKNKYRAEISVKPKNYKIRLIEIEFRDNCIFAKGVPYPDSKPTAAEKRVNVPQVLAEIKETVAFIKNAFSLEKIEVFRDFTLEIPEGKKVEPQHLDKILCTILAECFKLSSYTKENLHTFVQTFLEERSITQRLFLIKKKLEEVKNIMDIVSQSVKYSDDQVWKSHDSAKARLSYEYIRSNYFGGDPSAGTGAARGAAANQNANPNLTGPAKKFMEKLPLIKDEASREKVRKEIERFALQDKMSGEYHKLYTYLDDVFSIPWDKLSEEYWDIEYSHKVLEKQLFGLEKVKERIIEMIAVNKLKRVGGSSGTQSNLPEKRKGFVILLNGPPGTGKTTIAKAIATALKRESRFISFAGVTDPAFVKGHKRTYLDAQPGVFVKELIKARVMNPVFILDEVDKLGKHHQGVDPYYALMEILNPEENQNFGDHYLDIKVDFSNVIFILTSNHSLNMLEPLRNRLEIIEVPPYIEQEKLLIAKNYLLPSVLVENGLNNQSVRFDDETLRRIIKGWCYYESGVRELRRCIEKISRKHALEILDNYSPEPSTQQPLEPAANKQDIIETTSTTTASIPALPHPQQVVESQKIDFSTKPSSKPEVVPVQEAPVEKSTTKIDPEEEAINRQEVTQLIQLREQHKLIFDADRDPSDENLKKYLGLPVFDDMYERKNKTLHTGTANVLTVSGFVGHVLSVECVYDVTNPVGKGLFNCSGNLQKVLQESLTIARLNALTFLPADKIKEISEKNIHIHFLSGSSPKDGPSAGISICSALISLALNKPIDSGISMTGELSLNGEVYKIGGVQAKVTASKALDIKRIILPYGNRADFFELPQMLKEGLEVYFVKEYREVYKILFGDSPKDLEGIEKVTNGKIVPAMQRAEDIMAYTRT